MVAKDSSSKKEKIIKSKRQEIKKIRDLIDSTTETVEVKVGTSSIKIEVNASAISDKKTKPKGSTIKDMNIKEDKKEVAPVVAPVQQDNSHIEEEEKLDNTEVYDEGDLASAYERNFILGALKKHQEKLAPEKHPDFDGETCIDCGLDIPELRLQMGKIRCVICQDKLERRRKQYA